MSVRGACCQKDTIFLDIIAQFGVGAIILFRDVVRYVLETSMIKMKYIFIFLDFIAIYFLALAFLFVDDSIISMYILSRITLQGI